MKKIRENKGITLMALIVTIIVLLILAGISISALTGDNSIIKQAGNAKSESENAKEREALELAVVKAMGNDNNGNITIKNLNDELENQDVIVRKSGKKFIVTFNNSKKVYKIDSEGNVSDYVEIKPTENIYAKLYTDKTLILSSYDYIDPDRTVQTDYSNDKVWRSSEFTKVIIYDDIAPKLSKSCSLFYNCTELKQIEGIEKLHTDYMTTMNGMFSACKKLENLDVSDFDTSNVEDMSYMFADCQLLTFIDLSNFDTKKVKKMEAMFASCKSMKEFDLSSFDTRSAEKIHRMFDNCVTLTKINFGSNFDTSEVTNMSKMFNLCRELTELDISQFNTRKVENMSMMFSYSKVNNLDLSSFHTDALTDMNKMFYSCGNLESVNFANASFNNVINMGDLFNGDSKLNYINFKSADFSTVTNYNNFFKYCNNNNFTITVSSDSEKANAQKEFLTARRQEAGVYVPTYVTE